ncbi:DUF3332 domain-containing protein [Vibrio sp. FNV 38]|nr:DUF3332 domain-containing protein [Vibrio sp. FNV 38]
MNNKIMKVGAVAGCVIALSGCVGSNAVTGKLMEFNVKAVDNRYARGGLNMLLSPVYGITIAADYIVINSLEFWTGKNPITGAPHIFDTKVDTYIEVNQQLDSSLHDAPLPPITDARTIQRGQMKQIDENTLQMDITYNDGVEATLIGLKQEDNVTFYLDGQAIAQTTIQELEVYANPRT